MQRKGRIRCVEQVMPLVEDDPRHPPGLGALAHRVDHHQRVIGDDQVRLRRGPGRALDEAGPVVRASCIDALAAPVGQPAQRRLAEQIGQPARQVATDHVAVAAILRPARRQLREDPGAPRKAALHRVFQIEQTQVILAALAHHDLGALGRRIGIGAPRLVIELALQGLGIGRLPHRAARLRRP
jgi:hypothetical protein